jgi:hypothetical protein
MVLQNRTGPSARIGALSKASCSHFALEDSTEAPRPYLVVLVVVASKLTNFLKENDEKLTLVLLSGPAGLWLGSNAQAARPQQMRCAVSAATAAAAAAAAAAAGTAGQKPHAC